MLVIIILLALFILQVASIMLIERRRPSKAVAWMFLLFICPFIGLIFYFFLAKQYRQSVRVKRRSESLSIEYPKSVWSRDNEVQVFSDGNEFYDALHQAIEQAESYVWFQFYIINDDLSGERFAQLLCSKAEQGVQVKVLYDGLGSHKLPNVYVRELQACGVEVYAFLPVISSLFNRQINYRNHRKNVVIDGIVGFMGGFNIGDEYLGGDPKLGYWRDTQLQLTGSSVKYLQQLFQVDWELASGQRLHTPASSKQQKREQGHVSIQLVASTPSMQDDIIYESYFDAITSARKMIYLETPYFIPDAGLMTALKVAIKRGVDIRIIIPSVSDHALVQWGTLSFVEELLKYGVRVFQYQTGFLHAKVMIVDNERAIVGSANFDVRSFYDNFELNATIVDQSVIQRLLDDFDKDAAGSQEVILEEFKKRPRLDKLKQSFARMIAPLL